MRGHGARSWRTILVIGSVFALGGCAEVNLFSHMTKRAISGESPSVSGSAAPNYKVGKPYQVQGVWYYPSEEWDYDETGIASWYGPDFHNKLTANGEVFDQNLVSAAHKTLPMPSMVRVTNLENGRTLVVRVNDRGPFVHGRIIDLSRKAAEMLGIEGQGIAKVRVQILAAESQVLAGKLAPGAKGGAEPQVAAAPRASVSAETLPPPGSKESAKPVVSASSNSALGRGQDAATQPLEQQRVETVPVQSGNSLFIQAGSFTRYDNAMRLSARLSGVGKAKIEQASVKGQTVYRVRLGPLNSVEDADRTLASVIAAGQPDARVVVD